MTSSESPDITGMRAYAESLKSQFEDLVERGPDLAKNAREVQITEKSSDGLVSVTVNANGRLVRLDLDPRIYRRPDSRELADTIVDTIERASEAVQERVLDIFEPLVPREQMRVNIEGDTEAILDNMNTQINQIGR